MTVEFSVSTHDPATFPYGWDDRDCSEGHRAGRGLVRHESNYRGSDYRRIEVPWYWERPS